MMIYLASPYSDPDPAVKAQRFDVACEAAAALMRQGHMVFSPIAHTHPIARFDLPGGWHFWAAYDRAFIQWCDELWVLTLPGWDASVGVTAEIEFADMLGKPKRYIDPENVIARPLDAAAQHREAAEAAKGGG